MIAIVAGSFHRAERLSITLAARFADIAYICKSLSARELLYAISEAPEICLPA